MAFDNGTKKRIVCLMARKATPNPKAALERAITLIGSAAELARQTKWPKTTISSMRKHGRCTPHRAVKIESLTAGQVTRQELCPSVDW